VPTSTAAVTRVGKVDPSGEWAQVIWMTRVPTYKLSSWAKLQALNVLTSAAIAKAVGRSIWRYAATRLQANLLSKSAMNRPGIPGDSIV